MNKTNNTNNNIEAINIPEAVSFKNRSLYEVLFLHLMEQAGKGIGIAFSGGVDSSLLLRIACDAAKSQKRQVLAITFETKLHPHGDLAVSKEIADHYGALHKILEVDEFADPEIMNNPKDRCYRCKRLLFQTLINQANEMGYTYLIDGTNYDDRNAYRPGMKALLELGIHSPLLEHRITKTQIRSLAANLGISSSDRPSAPLPCDKTALWHKTGFYTSGASG